MADCDIECAFCGYKATAEEAAELYIAKNYSSHWDPKEQEEYPLHDCPNCDNRALVYELGYSETNGVCFACGDTPEPGQYRICTNRWCAPSVVYGGAQSTYDGLDQLMCCLHTPWGPVKSRSPFSGLLRSKRRGHRSQSSGSPAWD
jgi:hypothetical protein